MRQTACYVLFVAALLAAGCGHRAAPPPKAKPAAKQSVPLPDWAPKDPSPEFLRAARVLKPKPMEQKMQTNMAQSGISDARARRVRQIVWPASYEFFGSLTDKQIGSFMSRKEVSIPYKSLSETQRKSLERWFAAWEEANKGGPADTADYRVVLYKVGAKEDFSNLRVGVGTHNTHVVGMCFWVIGEKGNLQSRIFSDFAEI